MSGNDVNAAAQFRAGLIGLVAFTAFGIIATALRVWSVGFTALIACDLIGNVFVFLGCGMLLQDTEGNVDSATALLVGGSLAYIVDAFWVGRLIGWNSFTIPVLLSALLMAYSFLYLRHERELITQHKVSPRTGGSLVLAGVLIVISACTGIHHFSWHTGVIFEIISGVFIFTAGGAWMRTTEQPNARYSAVSTSHNKSVDGEAIQFASDHPAVSYGSGQTPRVHNDDNDVEHV